LFFKFRKHYLVCAAALPSLVSKITQRHPQCKPVRCHLSQVKARNHISQPNKTHGNFVQPVPQPPNDSDFQPENNENNFCFFMLLPKI
jgi:hypothetical protein